MVLKQSFYAVLGFLMFAQTAQAFQCNMLFTPKKSEYWFVEFEKNNEIDPTEKVELQSVLNLINKDSVLSKKASREALTEQLDYAFDSNISFIAKWRSKLSAKILLNLNLKIDEDLSESYKQLKNLNVEKKYHPVRQEMHKQSYFSTSNFFRQKIGFNPEYLMDASIHDLAHVTLNRARSILIGVHDIVVFGSSHRPSKLHKEAFIDSNKVYQKKISEEVELLKEYDTGVDYIFLLENLIDVKNIPNNLKLLDNTIANLVEAQMSIEPLIQFNKEYYADIRKHFLQPQPIDVNYKIALKNLYALTKAQLLLNYHHQELALKIKFYDNKVSALKSGKVLYSFDELNSDYMSLATLRAEFVFKTLIASDILAAE